MMRDFFFTSKNFYEGVKETSFVKVSCSSFQDFSLHDDGDPGTRLDLRKFVKIHAVRRVLSRAES